ncbi:23835_t:CDS:2, partial [Gigaspora margarita]
PVKMEDIVFEEENICDLDIASNVDDNTLQYETDDDKLEEELQINFKNNDFCPEELQGTTLNDTLDSIERKNKPEHIAEWPNNTYQGFMELIVEVSQLPKSTKNGKDYLNQIKSLSINFKEKVVAIYSGNNITLHYYPIFRAIQALLQRPEVNNNIVLKEVLKK